MNFPGKPPNCWDKLCLLRSKRTAALSRRSISWHRGILAMERKRSRTSNDNGMLSFLSEPRRLNILFSRMRCSPIVLCASKCTERVFQWKHHMHLTQPKETPMFWTIPSSRIAKRQSSQFSIRRRSMVGSPSLPKCKTRSPS